MRGEKVIDIENANNGGKINSIAIEIHLHVECVISSQVLKIKQGLEWLHAPRTYPSSLYRSTKITFRNAVIKLLLVNEKYVLDKTSTAVSTLELPEYFY